MIDWTKPIEAVHTDGRVVLAKAAHNDGEREMPWHVEVVGDGLYFMDQDGTGRGTKITIRNVEPTLRTSDEALRRMEALVERMAIQMRHNGEDYDEARAIQALRTPIDPRLEPVVRSLVANGISEPVARLYARDVLKALDADGAK